MVDVNLDDLKSILQVFDDSDWDELHLQLEDFEFHIAKDPSKLQRHTSGGAERVIPTGGEAIPLPTGDEQSARKTQVDAPNVGDASIPDGCVAVRAPNLGTFYRSPKPGAAPYVEVGQAVEETTEVCLIEVMKLFTPVTAGVKGVIKEVCASDAELIEHDQILFLVEVQE